MKFTPSCSLLSSGVCYSSSPSTVTAVKNGIKSIGVLKVDKDFGAFVEIDKRYWSKAVAPFVGERVSVLFMCFFLLNNPSTVYDRL